MLGQSETRLVWRRGLAHKHRVYPDARADLARELSERAARIDAGDVGLKKLEQEVAAARRRYEQAAIGLREARVKAAEGLDAAVAGRASCRERVWPYV